MIKAGQIEKGMVLLVKGHPHLVTDREFVNPGKGSAFVRLKLKNMRTGMVLAETYKTPDNVEEVQVVDKDAQYLYADGSNYVFMDTDTYDQFNIAMEGLEDKKLFMREGDSYRIFLYEDQALDIKIPPKMVFEIIEAEEAIRGNTVNGATKMVKVETGLEVRVPIFISPAAEDVCTCRGGFQLDLFVLKVASCAGNGATPSRFSIKSKLEKACINHKQFGMTRRMPALHNKRRECKD